MSARVSRRVLARAGLAVSIVLASFVGLTPAGAASGWTRVPTAAGAAVGHLSGVSCPTASMCFAVGWHDGPPTVGRVIERWNGKVWTASAAPVPSGATSSELSAVHCTSTSSCVAVGQYNTPIATQTLILRWNGHAWSLQPSPNVPTSPVNSLAGVHCTSSADCFAVGVSYASTPLSSARSTLIEHWDGTSWTIVPSPDQLYASDSALSSVACVNAANCYAVGSYDTSTVTNTLIAHWDGASWTIVPSPNPMTSRFNDLAGVTCTSAGVCFAVGSGNQSLVERLNGTTWSLVTSANPRGATEVSLTGISCVDASHCIAVGDQLRIHVVQRVVEMWNGSRWAVASVPVPTGTKTSNLSGVSCSPGMKCFAVGDYRVGPSRRPLLERYA